MKRKIKYALGYFFPNERDDKPDRKHLLTKCKKRSMRRFIQRDAVKEIQEGLKWLYESEQKESERMVLSYFGEEKGREILKEIDEELKQLGP